MDGTTTEPPGILVGGPRPPTARRLTPDFFLPGILEAGWFPFCLWGEYIEQRPSRRCATRTLSQHVRMNDIGNSSQLPIFSET